MTRRPSIKRRLAMALTITAVVVFAYTFVRATLYDPEGSGITASTVFYADAKAGTLTTAVASTTVIASSTTIAVFPQKILIGRLGIPSLGIDAFIQDVTVSGHNTIGVPTNFTDVGWYSYSPKPGQEGSAIIDGHVDNGLALAGVFKHLSDIKIGDAVNVTDPTGTVLHFQVIQVDIYPYTSTSTDALSYPEPGAYVRLITCSGTWLPIFRTYDKRIVVTAELVK